MFRSINWTRHKDQTTASLILYPNDKACLRPLGRNTAEHDEKEKQCLQPAFYHIPITFYTVQ